MKKPKIPIIALTFFIILFSLSCNTFEPVTIPGELQECNDMYTLMAFSVKMSGGLGKDKSATALTLTSMAYQDCKQARLKEIENKKVALKQNRFQDCKKMIYGPELLPKESNYKKYSEFLECLDK